MVFCLCFQPRKFVHINDFIDQAPSWHVNSPLGSQEIRRLSRNHMVHYRVHKSPSLVPVMRLMNPVHIIPPYYFKIHINVALIS
jgi:hypothetical protein